MIHSPDIMHENILHKNREISILTMKKQKPRARLTLLQEATESSKLGKTKTNKKRKNKKQKTLWTINMHENYNVSYQSPEGHGCGTSVRVMFYVSKKSRVWLNRPKNCQYKNWVLNFTKVFVNLSTKIFKLQ
jgi:plasmid maintenance system killer protein